MRRCLFFLVLAACGELEAPISVTVQMPQQAVDIKSIEVFVVRANKLGSSGTDVCTKFFADQLDEFNSDVSSIYTFDASAPQSSDLKAPPGTNYVVLARGWNVDIKTEPEEPTRRVLALGCVSEVTVAANKTTTFDIKMCLLRGTGVDPVCPAR